MTSEPEHLPAPVSRLMSSQGINDANAEFGALLMALSASKPKGLSLILLDGEGLNLSWIIAGLPNDAKLLATCSDAGELAVLRSALDTDLRVAFHLQEANGFIQDIYHHRFDLICCATKVSAESSQMLHTMLMPSGILITNSETNPELIDISPELASLLPIPAPLDQSGLKLYVKGERPLRRRGGRKAKHDRPSLRSA